MESKINYKYYDIIKKIKEFFECKYHIKNKYIAYCSICNINICDKCLNNSVLHIGHTILYFQKIMLSDKQVKYYRTIYCLCTFYLKRIREIIIELLSDFSEIIKNQNSPEKYPILLNIKNQLKNAYKQFYKLNIYQMQYAKNNLELFIHCKKWGYINYQIIKNIYNIKLNSIKIPDLQDKDIIKKIEIMIDFMKNNNNNILMSSDFDHPSTFYSYIDYNSKNQKVNTYTVKLSSTLFDTNKGEIFAPKSSEINNINKSISDIETNILESVNENDNINNNDTNNINQLEQNKDKNNNINDLNNNNNENNSVSILKEKKSDNEDFKNINNRINNLKENLSKINNSINNFKIIGINENNNNINNKIYQDDEYYYKPKIKNNLKEKENKNIKKINNIKEEKSINKMDNNISSNEKIKNYIYANLSKSSKEEVEYRDNIQYIYYDKITKKEINCKYYGEFKKGTLKRHGRGLFIWEDGEIYLGYWANDKREGEGTNTYPNGNIYQGNYKNGKKDGDGIYKWKNGDKYKGKWKNDMKDGKGIYEYSNGDIYDGYFKKDKIDGNGSYTWANKITYKGQFKNNLIDKKGI